MLTTCLCFSLYIKPDVWKPAKKYTYYYLMILIILGLSFWHVLWAMVILFLRKVLGQQGLLLIPAFINVINGHGIHTELSLLDWAEIFLLKFLNGDAK